MSDFITPDVDPAAADRTVDVAVIGAGHAGLNALKEVQRITDNYVLINGGPLGTTCARVGCMPSKVAIQIAHTFRQRHKYDRYGIKGAEHLQVDIQNALAYVREMRDTFVDLILANTTDDMEETFIDGYAAFLSPERLQVGRQIIAARRVIIATGSRPVIPKAWSGFQERIITTDDLFDSHDLPKRIAVIGLGPIGIEIGQALAHLGVDVIGFDESATVARVPDPVVNRLVVETIGRDFPLVLGQPIAITETGDGLRIFAGGCETHVDKIVACVGRTPNLEHLHLERLGVPLDSWGVPVFNPNTMQIGPLPVFIAGDATGAATLQAAMEDGRIAGYNAVHNPIVPFRRKTPMTVLFTDPNIAMIGRKWTELDESAMIVGQVRFGPVGRTMILGNNRGILRVYAERATGRVLGAAMIGVGAEHIAHLLAWGIEADKTVFELSQMPFYHPVIEEALQDVLLDLAHRLKGEREDAFHLPMLGTVRHQYTPEWII
ncbi:MAG: pyruvate/2-oxoglutarate dehydrogenase complex dihydrolipoamide dehydrogenase component [Rhodospirillaceae bacterium]|nr:MAG: pyruvate/2-oxoglutarate dehydrogenase complex dihydrolipoamide dehydrogenase component [Rhodospirillaceae bacterium]